MRIAEKRLQRILCSAYNEVPFFNNLINDLIEDTDEIKPDLLIRMPVFDKQKILEFGWANFISGQYLDADYHPVLAHARLERTSGTTGNPMKILWDNGDYFSSSINHWKYRGKNFGITPNSRMCTSSKSIPGGGVFYIDARSNQLTFSIKELNDQTITRIIEQINGYEPEWLYIQNSILYVLVYFAEKLGLTFPKSIRYIEYIGEPLCEYYRKRIAAHIPAPSSNMYGCVETNGISYECAAGNNHILPDNVLVQIVDRDGTLLPDGRTGFVCVTGLHNTAMPMLRYRLNDLANVCRNHQCACGNPNPIIEIKAGRMTEFLILDDDTVFPEAKFFCPINAGLNHFVPLPDDIVFNLKMNTLDHYEILVYQTKCAIANVEELLHRMFRAYSLPNIHFSVRYTKTFDASKPAGILRVR